MMTQHLPESMREELSDFAEFLRQRKVYGKRQSGNIAQRIHTRFKDLEGESLPIPERQLSRTPSRWDL